MLLTQFVEPFSPHIFLIWLESRIQHIFGKYNFIKTLQKIINFVEIYQKQNKNIAQ